MIGSALGHACTEFFLCVALAAVGLGAAFFETGDPGRAAPVEVCLGLNEVERMGEQLCRLTEISALELVPDALFHGVVESDSHGTSIGR